MTKKVRSGFRKDHAQSRALERNGDNLTTRALVGCGKRFPASSSLEDRLQCCSIWRIQCSEFAAKLLQALHLILEGRQRVRQAPNIDLQMLNISRESVGVGNEERQIKFAGDPQQRLNPSTKRLFARIPFALDAGSVVQPPYPIFREGRPLAHDPHRRGVSRHFAKLTEPGEISQRWSAAEQLSGHPDIGLERL